MNKEHIRSIDIYLAEKSWALKTVAEKLGEQLRRLSWDVAYKELRAPGRTQALQLYLSYDHLVTHIGLHGQALLPRSVLCFTHFEERVFNYIGLFRSLKAILVMSEFDAPALLGMGIPDSKLFLFPFGADLAFFSPSFAPKRDIDFIFSLQYRSDFAYSSRKNYRRVMSVANALADRGFRVVIVGPGWEAVRDKLNEQIETADIDYDDYPALYARARFYMSLSNYEGGPLSLLEAMMCGAYPLVTQTGFSLSVLGSEAVGAFSESGMIFPANILDHNITEISAQADNHAPTSPHKIRRRASRFDFSVAASRLDSTLLNI